MIGKTRELEGLMVKHMTSPELNCNPFTMALNGAVDAPVNGGVNMYRTTFFNPQYLEKNPDHAAWVEELKAELARQVRVVSKCVEVHAVVVPADVRPLHDKLVESASTDKRGAVGPWRPRGLAYVSAR